MTLQDWGAISEVVSAIAVVLTLVYLAVQIRLARHTIRAQMTQSATSEINAVNLMLANDGSWAEISVKAGDSLYAMTPEQRYRYAFLELSVCRALETLYSHFLSGSVAASAWEVQRATLVELAAANAWRQWWRTQAFPFTREFTSLVNSIIQENETVGRSDRITGGLFGEDPTTSTPQACGRNDRST